MGQPSSPSAARCSATATRPRTPSRRRSWCWSAGRRSLRMREGGSLGAWLHGVAYRTALKARKGAARRRAREHRVARPEARAGLAVAAVERDDLGAALHAEVTRLPAKYRDPVVLCYFEGRTHDEAAATLNWPVGTVRCRLSRARDLLRRPARPPRAGAGGRGARRGVDRAVGTGRGPRAAGPCDPRCRGPGRAGRGHRRDGRTSSSMACSRRVRGWPRPRSAWS